jgi:pimeloyl-ACP methyl ester carboxylesterase
MEAPRYVESGDGTRIGIRAAGEGAAIVFVHGACTSSADWAFARPLLEDRFTVVTMDRRGRGESADGLEYSMEREADDILAVLEAVDAELLVAHSYGALCSTLAVQRTDRLRRLVLYEPPIAVRDGRVPDLEALLAAGDRDTAVARFLSAAAIPDDQIEAIRESPAWPVLTDAVPMLPRELEASMAWSAPSSPIDIPLLYLVGGETDSPVYLNGIDDLLAAFPDHRREQIPGQRHIGHVLAADAFAKLVADFCA